MKYCPSCQTQYTDPTLRYCLQDGAPLAVVNEPGQSAGALPDDETETVHRRSVPIGTDSVETQWRREEARPAAPPSGGGSSKVALALTFSAIALVLVALVGAIGLYLYFRDPGEVAANNTERGNANPPVNNPGRTPTPVPTATAPSANQNRNNPAPPPAPPTVDREQASREVSALIESWRSDTEAGNIDSQLGKYASSVNYYQKNGAGRGFIRADKRRAFSAYDRISMEISNMNVSVDDSGEAATAVFDKEWAFEGERRSTGKVRQQIDLRRVNGKWLITGERDLRVYYTN